MVDDISNIKTWSRAHPFEDHLIYEDKANFPSQEVFGEGILSFIWCSYSYRSPI